jgi:hypothetical protein
MPNAAPAPAQPIRPQAPEVSILTSANPLPADVAAYERWRTGLTSRNVHTVAGGTWPTDCYDGESEKVAIEGDSDELAEFLPTTIYSHHGCNGRVDAEEYRDEAVALLEARTASMLARELWTGEVSGNPSLVSTGIDITAFIGGSVSAADGIAILLQAFSENTLGLEGTVHIPAAALGQLTAYNIQRHGNRIETLNGHPVITGPGYPGAGEVGPGGAEPGAGQVYAYVTGPVEVAVSPIVVLGTDANAVGSYSRQNLVEFYAERQIIYRFPTAPVFGLLIDLYTPNGA